MLSSQYLEANRGGVCVRKVIVYGFWFLGLGWLSIWGISAMVRDTIPAGFVWAFLSIGVWWLIGKDSKEEETGDK
jgi:hypothetical protein